MSRRCISPKAGFSTAFTAVDWHFRSCDSICRARLCPKQSMGIHRSPYHLDGCILASCHGGSRRCGHDGPGPYPLDGIPHHDRHHLRRLPPLCLTAPPEFLKVYHGCLLHHIILLTQVEMYLAGAFECLPVTFNFSQVFLFLIRININFYITQYNKKFRSGYLEEF